MPIDNHPLTQIRLQFIGISGNKLTLKSINIMLSSNNYNIVNRFICWNQGPFLYAYWGCCCFSFQDYSFQCYFRQRWYDNRLKFDIRNITEVTLNNLFLSHIWKPNTYFLNGHRSNQHNITVPNLFVRIREDGRVYLSRR